MCTVKMIAGCSSCQRTCCCKQFCRKVQLQIALGCLPIQRSHGIWYHPQEEPLFQTCRQLRDLILKQHSGLVVDVPAWPDSSYKHNDSIPDQQYWEVFELGCHALKRALETATQHSTVGVGLGEPNLCRHDRQILSTRSWGQMHDKLVTESIPLSNLRVLKVSSMQLPVDFFAMLARTMSSLQSVTLRNVQLEGCSESKHSKSTHASLALPLKHLELIDCCFEGWKGENEENSFNVPPDHFVTFPELSSFTYQCERDATSSKLQRCPWNWLLSSAEAPQLRTLAVCYSENFIDMWYTYLPQELKHLEMFNQLTCIKLYVALTDGMMAVMMAMPKLKQVELTLDHGELETDYSERLWPLEQLVISMYPLDQDRFEIMSHLPKISPKKVEVAHYSCIHFTEEQVPAFLALRQRFTWPETGGDFYCRSQEDFKVAIMLLPYIETFSVPTFELESEFAKAIAVDTQHRVITIKCQTGAPENVASVLPVLIERKGVMVLGPSPLLPAGPINTWDIEEVWHLLVDYRDKVLKSYRSTISISEVLGAVKSHVNC